MSSDHSSKNVMGHDYLFPALRRQPDLLNSRLGVVTCQKNDI